MGSHDVRTERDSMGDMEVPVEALYGASTMRAVLNFPISDLRFSRTFIRALGLVKQAAAKTYVKWMSWMLISGMQSTGRLKKS